MPTAMFQCHNGHQFPTHADTMTCPECGLRYRQEFDHWVLLREDWDKIVRKPAAAPERVA